ncbi:MAG TPA: hypothetical protein VMV83_04830 [Rectinemataceae bacterium]|nr:hypothetical protein [Rectinemataceae bacterium]
MKLASGRLASLAGEAWRQAGDERERIPALATELAGFGGSGISRNGLAEGEAASWRDTVFSRSVSLTLLAGSGSRWQASLAAARSEGRLSGAQLAFDAEAPRGLFPVKNFLHAEASSTLPIAAYSLAAVAGLGSHAIVIRDHEAEIRRDIIGALGLRQEEWRFTIQEAPFGKPLGHGDAAWQSRALWRDADWVVTNFGGDANSRFTVEASLLALAALDAAGEGTDFLLPAALLREPAYPIELDDAGRPLSFGHAKLQGHALGADRGPGWMGLANVGLRLYRASALAALLEELHDTYWLEGKGYAIPGNAPGNPEFALDNADAVFASRGRARVLAIARERELSPAKSFDELPGFEAAIAEVLAEDYSRGSGRASW